MSNEELSPRRGWLVSGRKLVIMLVVWSIVLAGSITGYAVLYGPQLKASGELHSAETVILAIDGMHCTGCADTITEAVKKEIGVVSAEVSFEKGEATIRYVASKTTRQRIREVIGGQGYTATTKEHFKPGAKETVKP